MSEKLSSQLLTAGMISLLKVLVLLVMFLALLSKERWLEVGTAVALSGVAAFVGIAAEFVGWRIQKKKDKDQYRIAVANIILLQGRDLFSAALSSCNFSKLEHAVSLLTEAAAIFEASGKYPFLELSARSALGHAYEKMAYRGSPRGHEHFLENARLVSRAIEEGDRIGLYQTVLPEVVRCTLVKNRVAWLQASNQYSRVLSILIEESKKLKEKEVDDTGENLCAEFAIVGRMVGYFFLCRCFEHDNDRSSADSLDRAADSFSIAQDACVKYGQRERRADIKKKIEIVEALRVSLERNRSGGMSPTPLVRT